MKENKEYSGKEIKKAGDILRENKDGEEFLWAMDVLSFWRFKHEQPLEKAFRMVQEVSIKYDKSVIFAKRLKRTPSIIRKLQRFKDMNLKNVQDIGGCRAIFSTEKKLRKAIKELKQKKEFTDEDGDCKTKDYILMPKDDGYRSYHMVCTIDKMRIEIQLRTVIQHSWATSLEIVDLFTGQALKSNQGQDAWKKFFKGVSDQFAIIEEIKDFYMTSHAVIFAKYQERLRKDNINKVLALETKKNESKLSVKNKLEAFAGSIKIIDTEKIADSHDGYVLLKIDLDKKILRTKKFSIENSSKAEYEYISEEKKAKKNEVVVLVSTTAMGDLKEAYPNYFADSRLFLIYLSYIIHLDRWM